MTFNKFTFLLLLVPLSFLSACGDNGSSELTEWMATARKEMKLSTPKLVPPKVFVPAGYTQKDELDPFNASKLLAVLARMKADSNNGPDMERRKEALEAFPLDSLKMVGTIEKGGLKQALVQADKTVYQAKVGGYIGQNFGLITGIAEDGVDIKETVQDAAGEWVERKVKLELQESQK
ncbi:pilus assembly protein PilP [Undibacterium jejuense]|uniref:Pilus assembly protein PilP n=1 Tax=Undibacterium jejuense TaxID=1344949 RepID=A0A923HDV6_9BURK|nr:pilus assembly protein PilP [Undibacterium jejuense]MBC3861265.1 pilus assembly protein PilP [Undibacterium jejuense]